MIIDLIQNTSEQLEAYKQLQTQKNQLSTIQITQASIHKLEKELNNLLEAYQLRAHYMPEEVKSLVRERLKTALQRLKLSQRDFSANLEYKQFSLIDELFEDIKESTRFMLQAWAIHLQQKVRPYMELAHIAQTLPQMQSKLSEIDLILAQTENIAKRIPNQKNWDDFNIKLHKLEVLLENLKGLDREKREFLDKVRSKQARVSDLTPELLKWCMDQGIATSLLVRFRNHD
jgi:uncharacterized protein YoxC